MVFILFGPIVWALHFLAVYGSQSLLCARAMPESVPPIVSIATVASLAVLVGAMSAPGALARVMRSGHWPEPHQTFISSVMLTLVALSLLGVAWAGGTMLILPSCSVLR